MKAKNRKAEGAPEAEPADPKQADESSERQVALLKAIIRVFRESMNCQSELEVAQVCLKVAEDLTGSAYGFIGELNPEGFFDTTAVSQAGWGACHVPDAARLLKGMPNHGVNRIGLTDYKSWIINDVAHHPESVHTPEGHPVITAFMGVPIRYSGGITGMIALASKGSGYTLADQEDVEALSVAFVESLNRTRAEKKVELLNRELRMHLRQVEAANKELEAFSYSVSHDLRAPVRHISGYLELLEKQDIECLDEKSRHYLEVVSSAAQRMGILIDDLLAFSRLGRMEMRTTRVAMDQLVKEVVQEESAAAKGREIEWDIAQLPVVTGDRAMLRQAISNLVANALKFSATRPVARIEIGALTDHPGEALFYVKDNGVGFDMKYHGKLFGLFQRLHSQEEFAGTGVGLAKVQRVVLRHGGRAWAEGEQGKGATFWFALPKTEEK